MLSKALKSSNWIFPQKNLYQTTYLTLCMKIPHQLCPPELELMYLVLSATPQLNKRLTLGALPYIVLVWVIAIYELNTIKSIDPITSPVRYVDVLSCFIAFKVSSSRRWFGFRVCWARLSP